MDCFVPLLILVGPLDAVACCPLLLLTCALRMTSSHSEDAEWGKHNPCPTSAACPPNHILFGEWKCGDPAVTIKASHVDPTTGHIPSARNFPYYSLKISAAQDSWMVGTNLGDIYQVDDEKLTIVHNWGWPVTPTPPRSCRDATKLDVAHLHNPVGSGRGDCVASWMAARLHQVPFR